MTMTATRPIDPDTLTLDGVRAGALRDRPVTVLGFARSGIALARFLADAGARVTVYDGRPAAELGRAIAALEGRPVRLLAGTGRRPGDGLGRGRARDDVAVDQPRLPDDRAAPPGRAPGARRRAGGRRRDRPGRRLRAGPVPAALPGADDRGDRHEGQDHDVVAHRRDPRGRPGASGRPRRQHRHADRRAAARAHRRRTGSSTSCPSCSCRRCRAARRSRSTRTSPRTTSTGTARSRRYRRVKRRLAELVDPAGALVLNARGPGRRRRTPTSAAPASSPTGRRPPVAGRPRRRRRLDRRRRRRAARARRRRPCRRPGRDGRILPVAELAIPGAHNVSNALAAVAVGLLFGIAPDAIRAAAAAFTGVEHRLEPVAIIDGVRFVNDSQGTQPDAVIAALRAFDPPVVLIAGGRDKGVDLSGLAAGRRRARGGGRADRRERAATSRRLPRRRPRPHGARGHARGGRAPRRRARPRGPRRRRRQRARRPSCSARPPPASTCSSTTPPAAAPSRPRSPRSPPSVRRPAAGGPR